VKRLHRDWAFVLGVVALTWFASAYGHSGNRLASGAGTKAEEEASWMLAQNTSKPQSSASAAVPKALAQAPIEMQRLAWLVGTWRADEKCEDTGPVVCRGARSRKESVDVGRDGLSLVSAYEIQTREGAVTGHQVIDYDRQTHGYRISGSDKAASSPSAWNAKGDWDSEVLSFQGTMERNGHQLQMKVLFYDIRSDSFTMILYLGEKPSYLEPVLTTRYVRVQKAEPAVSGRRAANLPQRGL
jgi:hypothetical protein